MEMQGASVLKDPTPFGKTKCMRCPKVEVENTRGFCRRCLSRFYAWRRKNGRQGTPEEFVIAMPWKAESDESGRDGVANTSETSLAGVTSYVRCCTCGDKTNLVQERSLCGACNADFVAKAHELGRELSIDEFVSLRRLEQPHEVPIMSSPEFPSRYSELIPGFLVASDAMREVVEMIRKVAVTDASVCIFGETGVGKELVAKAIHECSPRRKKPFVVVDCTSLGREIAENELFGHVRGAFTGAQGDVLGLMATAHTGTAFFDELSVLDMTLQPKLLRLLEQREYRPVGGTKPQKVDMRVIAASNQPLQEMVARGLFRADLYHRFNVFPLSIPALRERKEEIPVLVRYLLDRMNAAQITVTKEVEEALQGYSWPGNVRELINVLTHALIMKGPDRTSIRFSDLPHEVQ